MMKKMSSKMKTVFDLTQKKQLTAHEIVKQKKWLEAEILLRKDVSNKMDKFDEEQILIKRDSVHSFFSHKS